MRIMKKNNLLIAAMLIGGPVATMAQDDTEIAVVNAEGETEIIDLPEAMTAEVDSLLKLYTSQTYLQPDADCNSTDEDPYFEDDVYKLRLSQLPTVMEMAYNDVVRKFIDRYTKNSRKSVSVMLGRSNFYMPIFEEALEAYGLPLELKYLPVIESGLNPNAVSHVGATGLWQFMLTTGKQYGLEVNTLVDERRDPLKASWAAARYLRDLYKIFGDWNLVIAAYNCGPENVNKAIHRAKGQNDYWVIYPYLPRETRGYVPAFIAANYVMNYYCEHNICPMRSELPAKTDTIVVNRDVHFEQIANVLGTSIDQLKELNPQYRQNIVNGGTKASAIRMPSDMVNAFIDKENDIYSYNATELLTKRAVVEVKDDVPDNSVSSTTRQTSTRQATTRQSSSRSYASQGRRHGSRETTSTRSSRSRRDRHSTSSSRSRRNRGSQEVTIKKGESLSTIARKNGTTVEKLKKLNGIKSSNIRAGKKLKVK